MSAEIWGFLGSILVGLMTMGGVIYSSKNTKRVNDVMLKNQMDTIANQIKALEVKMEKHNSIIERTYLVEKSQAEIARDVQTLYDRVDDIKKDVKEVRTDMESLTKNVSDIKECEIRLEGKVGN